MSKKLQVLGVLVSLAMVTSNCKKKDIPETEIGNPVFYLDALINGSAVNLTAGKDNFYMFTNYAKDDLGIIQMKGSLRSAACEQCDHALSISFRDTKMRGASPINDIADVLSTGNYLFYNASDTTVTITEAEVFQFMAYQPQGVTQNYLWDFGDGTNSTLPNTSHTYTTAGNHTVCLTVSKSGSASKTVCNLITADTLCRVQFTQNISQNEVQFSANGNFSAYAWSFGDSVTNFISSSSVTHTYNVAGVYRVSVKDTLTTNMCANTFKKDIVLPGYAGNELAAGYNYSGFSTILNQQNPLDSGFKKVVVNYTSPSGKKYTSYTPNAVHNQSNNTFLVNKSEPYTPNKDGDKTYKIEGEFKVWLYNESNVNDSIFIQANKFITGVAFP